MVRIKVAAVLEKIRNLNGDPHYVALGMAIGVFIAVTPTIPFHTILAIALALGFKASKPAAIIGVWASNPFTVVFLYFACYKAGHFFFDGSASAMESIRLLIAHFEGDADVSQKISYFIKFITTQLRTFMIMNFGGIVLGLPAGLFTYAVTRRFITQLRKKI